MTCVGTLFISIFPLKVYVHVHVHVYVDFQRKAYAQCMLLTAPLPNQNEYTECADLILSHYPDQVDHLLSLVFSEKIPESKMQLLLEYLSKSRVKLLSMVLTKLANNTCTAGMELLR